MTTNTNTSTSTASTGLSTRQRAGLVLCAVYCVVNAPSPLFAPDDGEVGPPLSILYVDTVLAVVGLVAVVAAWRGSALGLRVAAGAIILITLTSLPAFFVDVPVGVKAGVGVAVLVTLLAVVLMLSGPRRRAA